MAHPDNLVFELHDLIEAKYDLNIEKTRVSKIAISAAQTLESRVDTAGLLHCLDVAGQYWNNDASEAELYTARMSAWDAIKGRSVDFSDSEVNLVRLLLCALYGRKETDIPQDSPLYIVLDFAINAGVQEKILIDMLQKQFQLEFDKNT